VPEVVHASNEQRAEQHAQDRFEWDMVSKLKINLQVNYDVERL
jgi:hypothetical protein